VKAVVHDRYGSPGDVLELVELEKPGVADDGVLVRVHAASINPVDWYGVTGRPMFGRAISGLRKPKDRRVGTDFAGTAETVGKDVTEFAPGDEVFGARTGALAEYVSVPADEGMALKPANLTFEEAASVRVAGLTALQGLRNKGGLEPGQKVLINGASGGVGTFAVQIAKALGAEVTAVCSTRNVDIARSLGADRVIDYTREDFTRGETRYDLLLDVAGSRRWSEVKRVLKPDGKLVIVGAPKGGRFLGPVRRIARLKLASIPSSQKAVFLITKPTKEDLNVLRDLVESRKVKPVIDRTYPLSDVRVAFEYLGEGHAQGKVVVTI
jgi:NADPH:quinone reductase-like Zn-dependent oxidoreductase